MPNASNVVQETTDYERFSFIKSNREQYRGHIESVKDAFEEYGNLTRVQPILVNERFEIIDGQHRFTAAAELGQPIHYTMVPGLGINEARAMNILHRSWTSNDFAQSYAQSGNKNYVTYLELKEDYGFNHSIMLFYIEGYPAQGLHKKFREGDFEVKDLQGAVLKLTELEEVFEYTSLAKQKSFATAYLRIISNPDYNHSRFVKKLVLHGETVLKKYVSVEDNLRQIEELYNYKSTASNRVRLY